MAQKRLIEASIEILKKELAFYQLPSFEKIALFKKRFFARVDVYAKERQNKKGYYPLKDTYEHKTFTYLPLTDEAIKEGLAERKKDKDEADAKTESDTKASVETAE